MPRTPRRGPHHGPGEQLRAGSLSFDVLNPLPSLFPDSNNCSVVLRFAYGEVVFLFTGDAERDAEASMLAAGQNVRADVLKVGHHGSRTVSSAPFLAAAKPKVAVYMAGVNNRYGHPHAETITGLQAAGARIYGTDKNGTLTVATDGTVYRVVTEK